MKKYMYEGVWTQELENHVENSIAKPLVEEMFYRFGLKVYAMSTDTYGSFLMTLDGLPYCEVYAEKVFNTKKEVEEITYCYYSQYYGKERGRDSIDRHTLRSTKLTKLMQTLEKNKAIMPDHTALFTKGVVNMAMDMALRKHGVANTRKYSGDISIEMIEKLLNIVINKAPAPSEDMVKYKLLLDKWNQANENTRQLKDKLISMFGNECYVIAETDTKGLAIASFKLTETEKDLNPEYEIIKPFQRVPSLDDYEYVDDIRLPLTMLKLHVETKDIPDTRKRVIGLAEEQYYEDMGVIQLYERFPAGSDYHPLWTIIPTNITQ